MLNFQFTQNQISSIVVYALSTCKESLGNLNRCFKKSNIEIIPMDLTNIPNVDSKKNILLIDKKLEAKIDQDNLENVLFKKFHLYSFSNDLDGMDEQFSHIVQGHLKVPFQEVDAKNLLEVTRLKNVYNQKLQNMEKVSALGCYTGSLIHDLNNYNSLCMTSLDAIKLINKAKYNDEKIHTLAQKGLKGTVFLRDLAKRYHFLLKGEQHYKKEEFNLKANLENSFSVVEYLTKAHKIQMKGLDTLSEKISMISDPLVFSQVTINLLKNSVDAIKNLDQKWIELSLSEIRGVNYLLITDSGAGISEEIKKQLFEKGQTSKPDASGFGLTYSDLELQKLGLELVYIEANNTTFGIKIPSEFLVCE